MRQPTSEYSGKNPAIVKSQRKLKIVQIGGVHHKLTDSKWLNGESKVNGSRLK